MRAVSLAELRLLSEHQPKKLRVDNHKSGLHSDDADTAWIVVNVAARDWCKLAYQFGHELGHVLCNSWRWGDNPHPPSQWLEESVAEAFSLRGLALLADSWEQDPPFPNDSAYGVAIRQYYADLRVGYYKAAQVDLVDWLRAGRPAYGSAAYAPKGPAVAPILSELEWDKRGVQDLAALNRWPERTRLLLEEYLQRWQQSCKEINSPGLLPARLRALFNCR
jgi:hypothetical protein